ncbi:hypothetical protein PC129_g17807 [Phytophthora cactorum]|uniref:Uncharacterized protein n=1 Tax=Phytophthora cactorum TaxID=29920 RepID=A0A8T0YS60_9STRA|nr:hypothetical protein Pcac1_g10152 [Phytophthora cactorum]KAG2809273.1 hypothetical protein PC111_g16116 [Phytophthora cactorum]KAG2813165.1 hypothetical protein PC112_g14848 [Phytophthora cactorum]KAG2852375.1 hypothetical protein PC113_g15075 [Phytophthora cactorum]KAG2882688.1 hypothetical protein PC114_g20889 [Phytophthora cactorum]
MTRTSAAAPTSRGTPERKRPRTSKQQAASVEPTTIKAVNPKTRKSSDKSTAVASRKRAEVVQRIQRRSKLRPRQSVRVRAVLCLERQDLYVAVTAYHQRRQMR